MTHRELFKEIDRRLAEAGIRGDVAVVYGGGPVPVSEGGKGMYFAVRRTGRGIRLDIVLPASRSRLCGEAEPVLGSYRSLKADDASYRRMCMLGTEFVLAAEEFIRSRPREAATGSRGYDVHMFRTDSPVGGVMHADRLETAKTLAYRQIGSDPLSWAAIRETGTGNWEPVGIWGKRNRAVYDMYTGGYGTDTIRDVLRHVSDTRMETIDRSEILAMAERTAGKTRSSEKEGSP